MGNYELRCGAWVVERWGSSTYDIRHVAADKPEDGYRLRKAKGRWRMDRGYARSITIFGGTMSWIRYRLWKRAAG